MKIGIDYISAYGSGGNGTYTRELVNALGRTAPDDAFFLYTYLHHRFPSRRHAAPFPTHRYAGCYFPSFSSSMLTGLGERMSRRLLAWRTGWDGLDVIHFTNPLSFVEGIPAHIGVVVTIHDLAFLKNPAWVKPSTAAMFAPMLKRIVERSDAIIAVSQATAADLGEQYPESRKKITVVYEGASGAFIPRQGADEAFLGRYGLHKPYVLSVGEVQPRKNLEGLLCAYAKLPPQIQAAHDLVLVGAPRNEQSLRQLEEAIKKHGLENHVRIIGYVPQDDLARLYQHAATFVFLSHWEGFGLPVLEAMACGTAILASDIAPHREVGGDACLYAAPSDAGQASNQMRRILDDAALRDLLKQKALVRARDFSWDKAAGETQRVYERVKNRFT